MFAIGLCSVILGAASLRAEDPTTFQKKVYEEVNDSLGTFKVIETEVKVGDAEEESIAKGWFQDGTVRKLEIGDPGEHGNCTREYYFDEDGNLVFVFQTVTTEEMQTGKIVAKVQDRFYFDEGKLFRWLDTDKKVVPKDDARFVEYEGELLKLSSAYSSALSKVLGGKSKGKGSARKQTTQGTFLGIDQGDYLHLNMKDAKGEEVSFFLLRPDKSFDPFIANPGKYEGKKVKVTWESKKENIPEAGGETQVESAISIELVK